MGDGMAREERLKQAQRDPKAIVQRLWVCEFVYIIMFGKNISNI